MSFTFSPHFTAFLAAVLLFIAVGDSDALPGSQANAASNAGTNCAWDCKVVDSTFGLEMKVLFSEFRLISLQLKHDQQVDEKCVNQTDRKNSSIKLADLWTWLTGDNPSQGGQNMSQHSLIKSNYRFQKLVEGQIEVRVSCSLKPAVDLNGTEASLNDVIAMMLIEEVATFADLSHSETAFCYKQSAANGSYVCVNITLTNTFHNNPVTWKKQVFYGLALVVVFISLFCFPLLWFLFTPTKYRDEATDEVMIVLHGTSPESIRSWIANKFCLDDVRDNFVKQKLKRLWYAFLLFVITLGFTTLASEIQSLLFPPTNLNIRITFKLSAYMLPVLFVELLMIRAFIRFLCQTLSPGRACIICSVFGDEQNIVHDLENSEYYGPKEMEMHLLFLPSIIKRCFTQTYRKCAELLDCCCPSSLVVKQLFSFLLFPVWITVYLVYVVAVLLYSSPSSTLYDMLMYQNPQNRHKKGLIFSGFLETSFLLNGAFIFVVSTAINLLIIFRGCLLGLPNYLPYASLLVVTVFYVWNVYIPHPRKYNKLAFKLLAHYKKKQGDPEDCTRMIPKDLYDKGCEKLMPLKKSRSKLIAAIFAILIGIFAVFVTITEAPRLDDQTKALGTLLAILLPKIADMLFGKDPTVKKADDEDFDKKVASFVNEYPFNYTNQISNSNNNNGSSAGNNSSSDTPPLLPSSHGSNSEDTGQGRTSTGALLPTSETV